MIFAIFFEVLKNILPYRIFWVLYSYIYHFFLLQVGNFVYT